MLKPACHANMLTMTMLVCGGLAGINICAVGLPQNYYLNSVLPTIFSIMRTGDFNYLSVVSKTNGANLNCIIEDLLF